jgi:hypothetical protein
MRASIRLLFGLARLLLLLPIIPRTSAAEWQGSIIDKETGQPVAGATITAGDRIAVSGSDGKFRIELAGPAILVRASGYRRLVVTAGGTAALALEHLRVKSLYLTVYGIGAASLREPALAVVVAAGLNAVVIDIKGDRGLVPYPSKLPLAAEIGALKLRSIPDLPTLVAGLKARGLYTIARIVVFKDTLLAQAKPEWAVRVGKGVLWHDREGLAWIDPFQTAAWDHTLGIAEEAAASGFDEIQFDYARFPDAAGLSYSRTSSQADRCHRRVPERRAAAAAALQRLPGDRRLRLRLLEHQRHVHRPKARGPGGRRRLHLPHALSFQLPVRDSRPSQPRTHMGRLRSREFLLTAP